MKRWFVLILIGILVLLAGCSTASPEDAPDTLQIVTTIFPAYDFAREIAGGEAELTMLLKPGTESHSYEPSPADILLVESCDLFIYNGGESDIWVEDLLSAVDMSNFRILKMMDCVQTLEEVVVEGMQTLHSHAHEHEELEEREEDYHHGEEFHPKTAEYDEHVWTSPRNAFQITAAICKALTEIDSKHTAYYQSNLERYQQELLTLDRRFREIVKMGTHDTIIFGDRFPFRYFAEEYGLDYYAAFPGCSAEAEPTVKTVAYLIDKVRQEGFSNIFYIEFSNQKIAKTIQEETGAVPLLFHSCHNLTPDEMEQGITYLDFMNQNAENLKEALE